MILERVMKKIKKIYTVLIRRPVLKIISCTGLCIYRLRYGKIFVRKNTTDLDTFADIFIFGGLKLSVKIEPKFIVDAGAYTGYSSIFFSKKYPKAKIFSIEPEDSNFEMLKKNINNNPNIKPIKAGLWNKNTFLKIVDRKTGHWGFMTREVSEKDGDIKTVTIDKILEESGFDFIDILKIDIEGSEKELFSENYDSWINKVKVLMIEFHERINPGCKEAVYSSMNNSEWIEYKKNEKIIFVNKK